MPKVHAVNKAASADPELSVGEVAKLVGVSVRTLHHYDSIGLLSPQSRSEAGYRLYGREELERLQQILSYRELGFELEAVAQLLDNAGDPVTHLIRQEALLNARLERLLSMRRQVRRQMEARKMGIDLTPKEMFEVFGNDNPAQYAEEAEQRWGNTDAYRQSQKAVKGYTKDDWQRIKAQVAAVEQRFIELMQQGVPADDERTQAAAEAHRQHITSSYYDCTYEIHTGLADMYEADPRFTKYYDDQAAGLAAYVAAAIRANAAGR